MGVGIHTAALVRESVSTRAGCPWPGKYALFLTHRPAKWPAGDGRTVNTITNRPRSGLLLPDIITQYAKLLGASTALAPGETNLAVAAIG